MTLAARRRHRSSGHRSTLSTWRSAPGWCRSPDTRCRCSIPPASCRSTSTPARQAGLFDVSHMGQVRLAGADAARALEALVPGDLLALVPRHMRYTLLLNEAGGILDDLMATRLEDGLFLVVNAARKEADLAHLQGRIAGATAVEPLADKALLALQGPAAATVLSRFAPAVARLGFMTAMETTLDGRECLITRSGYTGEDGFEISLPASDAAAVAEMLLAQPEVRPIGLGARDLAAPRGRALPLRARYRRDDDPGRGRARAGRSAGGGGPKAGFPARRSCCASWPKARRAGASASGPMGARRRARTRRSSVPPGRPSGE